MPNNTVRPLRLLLLIILLWLVGVAFLANAWIVGIVLLVPGILALALCIREIRKADWGSMAAWATCSLAPLACLALFALANVHAHEFTGGGPGCDAMAQDCNPQVAQGIAHSLSLALFLVAGILTLRLIALSRRHVGAPDYERT